MSPAQHITRYRHLHLDPTKQLCPEAFDGWLEKMATDETDVLDIFREAQELRGAPQPFLGLQKHIGEKFA
jgi:hypothetical protein